MEKWVRGKDGVRGEGEEIVMGGEVDGGRGEGGREMGVENGGRKRGVDEGGKGDGRERWGVKMEGR